MYPWSRERGVILGQALSAYGRRQEGRATSWHPGLPAIRIISMTCVRPQAGDCLVDQGLAGGRGAAIPCVPSGHHVGHHVPMVVVVVGVGTRACCCESRDRRWDIAISGSVLPIWKPRGSSCGSTRPSIRTWKWPRSSGGCSAPAGRPCSSPAPRPGVPGAPAAFPCWQTCSARWSGCDTFSATRWKGSSGW